MTPPPADSGSTGASQGGTDSGREGPGREAMGTPASVEACVDRWLEARKLDRNGHPEGTMYAGGSPLFNERTGETRDRMEYVFERQPEARAACAHADGGAKGR